jgi:hypothetical protein
MMYYRFALRMGDSALAEGCDEICLHGRVCDIVANTPGKCEELPWPTTPAPRVK